MFDRKIFAGLLAVAVSIATIALVVTNSVGGLSNNASASQVFRDTITFTAPVTG
jgi:hypothetical protein